MQRADEQARRLGIDRREFLASSMGMMTTLAVINQVSGCSGERQRHDEHVAERREQHDEGRRRGRCRRRSDDAERTSGGGRIERERDELGRSLRRRRRGRLRKRRQLEASSAGGRSAGGMDGGSSRRRQIARTSCRSKRRAKRPICSRATTFIFDIQTPQLRQRRVADEEQRIRELLADPRDLRRRRQRRAQLLRRASTTASTCSSRATRRCSVITSWPAQLCTQDVTHGVRPAAVERRHARCCATTSTCSASRSAS